MIKVKEAIIVEGKYDKIKLSSIVDGLIIDVGGFNIFKNKDMINLIKRLSDTRGILVFTDSDGAGLLIRNYLNGIIPKDKIKHAYIPDIYGKEKRKDKPSKEGKLGVEGVPKEIIIKAIERSGADCFGSLKSDCDSKDKITKQDLYEMGYIGKENSSKKRKELLKQLDLPENLSVNALIKVLSSL